MSYMFHFPNLKWTRLQAEAIGIPQLTATTEGIKEEELADLERAVVAAKAKFRLEGIYTGALASVYQKKRVERICQNLRLECVSPLWGIDPEYHLRRLVRDGFSAIVVSVSALGLDESWLGRGLDQTSIDGETFVLDAPFFSRRIEIHSAVKHWQGDSGYFEITDAVLASKP
jgi:diphthine-ammonia ligase